MNTPISIIIQFHALCTENVTFELLSMFQVLKLCCLCYQLLYNGDRFNTIILRYGYSIFFFVAIQTFIVHSKA